MKSGVILLFCALFVTNTFGQCDPLSKEKITTYLGKFHYDASKTFEIKTQGTENIVEVGMMLFQVNDYRFVFDPTNLPEGVKIEVYNKSKDKGDKRKMLYSTAEAALNEFNVYDFHPDHHGKKVYVNFVIPPNSAEGCGNLLIGYKARDLGVY